MFWLTLACSSAPAPVAPYFDAVPAYPNARQLCTSHRALSGASIDVTVYVSADELPSVVAWYQENHGEAVVQPTGAGLLVRGKQRQMLSIDGIGAEMAACPEAPTAAERTTLVVSRMVPGSEAGER